MEQTSGDMPLTTTALAFLEGGGEMGALLRAHDWSRSSLGPPAHWPPPLRTVVRLMLNTGHAMYVFWGADGACLYNDAYRQSLGPERHPGSLGRPAFAVWEEIWPIIGPQIAQVMEGRGATWNVDHLVPSTRHGRLDPIYWTYSYSPIDDESAPNGIGGVLVICTETTQHVRAAERLTSERDQLAQLFEQAPTFMAMLRGPEHRFELANPGYMQLVGPRDILGRTVAEALPEAIGQGYLALLDQVYRSGEAYVANGALFRVQEGNADSAHDRVLDFVYQPLKDSRGQVTGIFVEGVDVTERARIDAALRDSNSRLALLDAIGEATRLQSDARAVMQASARLLGEHLQAMRCAYADVERDQNTLTVRDNWNAPGSGPVVGGSSLARFGPVLGAQLLHGRTAVVRDIDTDLDPAGTAAFAKLGIRAMICCPMMKSDGLRGLLAVHAAGPRDWSVHEVALVEAVAERSWAHVERVRSEALREANEQYLAELIDTMPSLIWTADANGELRWGSRWLQTFTGRAADQLGNQHWPAFMHPDDLPDLLEAWAQSLADALPFRSMCRLRRADGQWRWLMLQADPVLDDHGGVRSWCGSGIDVHDFREASDALEESEARFREMAGKLSDANRLKDEFLATLAHELRNPLAPIRNTLALMKLAPDDSQIADSGRAMMERQILQMVRLIDDLTDLSRVSRGIVELRRLRLSMASALKDAVETSRPLIDKGGHHLTLVFAEEDLAVHADPTRIVQVFANLLNNAAKFTPRGGRIQLQLQRLDADRLLVSVRDNGVGIPTPMLERVFDMFAQVARSHAHVGGGLGIGLTLVRRLVEMHGGTVEARSDGAGTGSEFRVLLPLLDGPSASATAGQELTPVQAAPGRRIVVVDDNVDAAQSLSQMLQVMGHDIRTAYDGEEAFAIASAFQPDAMVLDIAMPRLDGHALARRIRASPWGRSTLLIAASGWGQNEDKRLSLAAGFDHHLVKPVEFRALQELLQR